MIARKRAALFTLFTLPAGLLVFACSSSDEQRSEPSAEASAGLAFADGNDGGYCASNPSASCSKGTALPSKTLALTFDDGPGSRTLELSAWLRKQGIPAVFFVNGRNYGANAASLLAHVAADGHLVANHTEDHLDLTTLSSTEVVNQVTETDALIAPYVTNRHFLFRAPFGNWNSDAYDALQASPMKKYVGPVKWDIGGQMTRTYAADWDCWQDTSGYGVMTTKACGDRYLNEIRDVGRGIVLIHDQDYGDSTNHSLTSGKGNSVDMIEYMVPLLRAQGYSFVRADTAPDIAAAFGTTPPVDAGNSDAGKSDAGSCAWNPTWTQTSYANDWWVEYSISGSVTAASLEVIGGATTKLSSSYGKWVGGPPAEILKGTPARLHATASGGQTATTQTFAYLTETSPRTDCSGGSPPPPPPSSCFTTTWSEGDGANTWWVEYAVAGSIASVYLEVPGRGNVALTSKYGKWVGGSSFAIPEGTSVVAHATNTAGATARTNAFAYLDVTRPSSAACP